MPPMLPLAQPGAPDPFAPGGSPWSPAVLSPTAVISPVYTGTAPPGTQLFWSSAAYQASVVADMGSVLQVSAVPPINRYPYKLLLEWGTGSQEIVIATSAPSLVTAGVYAYTGVLRGCDGGGPQIIHAPGAQVSHGVSEADFAQSAPVYNVCSTQFAGGADPNGMVDSSPAVQAAISACIADGGGIVQYPAGTFLQLSTVTAALPISVSVNIQGMGLLATMIQFAGAGDCIRMYCPTPYVLNADIAWGSGVSNLGIDGTYANPGVPSNALHLGDMGLLRVNAYAQNFTYGRNLASTVSVGLLLDNTVTWSEQCDVRFVSNNCTRAMALTVTSGYNSYGYSNIDLTVFQQPGQDGLAFLNGAFVYRSKIRLRGNFQTDNTPMNSAVLRCQGVNVSAGPSNGNLVVFQSSQLDIGVECDGGEANAPTTIWMDQTNFAGANGIYGLLNFSGPFVPAHVSTPAQFQFTGMIDGDTNLAPSQGGTGIWRSSGISTAYSSNTVFPGATTNCSAAVADFFKFTLTSNTTMTLVDGAYFGGLTRAVPQRITIEITQAASGGPYTVTWPSGGTPSTSAPVVVWAGGVAPQMSATAGVSDVYTFESYDGIFWYGRAVQPSQVADTEQFTALASGRTLTSNTSAQAIFNATAAGALTAQAATTYFFECVISVTGLSGSAHSVNFGFGGTATYTSAAYQALTATAAGGTVSSFQVAAATASAITTTGLTTTVLQATIKGVIRVNAGGTVIPQITQVTASAGAIVAANSWFRIWPAGSNTVTNVGNWS